MADDITIPFTTDPDDLADEGFDYYESETPGFERTTASPETRLLAAFGRIAAHLTDVASQASTAIFRYFGPNIANASPTDAASASVTSTWTLVDDTGYTIPEGTQVTLPDGAGGYVLFTTLEDVTVAPGDTATAAGEVTLVAAEPGEDGNDLSGPAELVDVLAYVSSIALVGTTDGGEDAEEDEDYLPRLRDKMTLLSPAPILPRDVALLAQDDVGVHRAVAIDGYQPEHNLLTANQASLETDLTGWVAAGTNCTASRSTTTAKSGTASLRLSSTASGDMSTTTDVGLDGIPVTAGEQYIASAFTKADANARTARIGIRWYDDAGVYLSEDLGTGEANATANYDTDVTVTATAPVDAAFAALKPIVLATAAGSELHYFDQLQLRRGSVATPWVAGDTTPEDNERTCAVACIDEAGAAVSTQTKTRVQDSLTELRELNFQFPVIDPTYTAVDVTIVGVAHDNYDADDVATSVEEALAEYLDPASFALPPGGDAVGWRLIDRVRYLEVAEAINRVDGFDYISTLTMRKGAESHAADDVLLAGPAPLPTAGTITVTVT